jgi:hypothetical protein
MTDTMTSQNIVLSSWDTLYIYIYIYVCVCVCVMYIYCRKKANIEVRTDKLNTQDTCSTRSPPLLLIYVHNKQKCTETLKMSMPAYIS